MVVAVNGFGCFVGWCDRGHKKRLRPRAPRWLLGKGD